MMASAVNQTTWTHVEMITIILREMGHSHLNPEQQQQFMMNYSMKPAVEDSITHYTAQIQAILALLISKLFNPQTVEISLNFIGEEQQELMRNSFLTMSDWVFYILTNYGDKLKPGFMGFIRNRVSEIIASLAGSKGSSPAIKSPSTKLSPHMSQSMPVANMNLSQQLEESKVFESPFDMAGQGQAGEIMETIILSITLISQALITLGSTAQIETNSQFVLLPLAKLALNYHDLTSEPVSSTLELPSLLPLTHSISPLPTNSTLSTMILTICHLQQPQAAQASKQPTKGAQQFSLPKSEKFVSVVLSLITKMLHQAVTNYVHMQGIGKQGASGIKEGNEMEFPMIEIISDQTKKELEQITSQKDPASQLESIRFHNREAQISWLKLALCTLRIAVESIRVITFNQQILRKTFDLFKCTVFLVGHFNLSGYEEHFWSQEIKGETLIEAAEQNDTQCLISQAFQIVTSIMQTDFKQNIDEVLSLFEELSGSLLPFFEKVDTSFYMKTIYLTFLQKILDSPLPVSQNLNHSMLDVMQTMIGVNGSQPFNSKTFRSLGTNLLKLFTSNFYSESRIKDVEPVDGGLKHKPSYKLILAKLRQIELKQQNQLKAGRAGWATTEINRMVAQQMAFEMIVTLAQGSQQVAEKCLAGVVAELKAGISYEQSNSRIYQQCKLAIAIIQREMPRKEIHKKLYEILLGTFVQPKYTAEDGQPIQSTYKTWLQNRFFEKNEDFKQIWVLSYQKCKQHLAGKIAHQKSIDTYFKSISATSQKQQEIVESVMRQNIPQIPEGMLRDATFTIIRKLYMFGLTNIEIARDLEGQMKDILKETRDFEHSFELKIAICQSLMIIKDRNFKQLDALLRFDALLKILQEFILQVDNKYGHERNVQYSSARRALEGQDQQITWEQERDLKVRHIKALVGQCINVFANYIDFKESQYGQIALVLEAKEKNLPGPQALQLDLVGARSENYSFDETLGQLKRIVVNSNMYGGFFVEQLMRIFFFQRVDIQNLCLTKNMNPGEMVFDPLGVQILDYALNFLVDVPPQMYLNGLPVVKSFVSFIHSRLNTPGVANQAHLKLARFAKCLTVSCIKHIKKIMIYIREKEDAETGTTVSTQMRELMIKILAALPRGPIYKEFFGFMREIFYYNKDMDDVDYNLATDTLLIMNNLMKLSVENQQREGYHKFPALSDQGLQMTDFFTFSDLAQGVILHDSFIVPQDSFSISLLFKLNIAQIRAMQERNTSGMLDSNSLTMTFFQIIDKTNKPNYTPFSIIINVVNDRLQICDYDEKIDENWHTLVVYFDSKRKGFAGKEHQIKIFIDQLQRNVQTSNTLKHTFHKSHQHLLVYGCDARDIMSGVKPGMISSQISQQLMSQNISGNFIAGGKLDLQQDFKSVHYFQGSLSLPMFFWKMETDRQGENQQLLQFIIRSIAMKRTVGINTLEYVQIMKDLSRSNSLLKDALFGTFETMDQINEEIILIHQKAYSLDHLSAVHHVKPAQILDVMGGYQLLYPVFEKSMFSNLTGYQISDLWKLLFKLLRSFMQADPQQIKRLHKSKHLIQSLKSCIIRGSKNGLNILTKDLLLEILNVVRDVHTNKYHELLEEFYRDYMLLIILDESFCDMTVIDRIRNRKGKVFEDVVDNLVSLYNEEENNALSFKKVKKGEFFTPGTSKEVYTKVFGLIIKYQNTESIQQTKQLAYVLMKILVNHSLTDKFISLIEGVQLTGAEAKKPLQRFSKVTLLAKLKILEGVIIDPSFDQTQGLVQVLKGTYRRELMENHLNQTFSYKQQAAGGIPFMQTDEEIGGIEDDIIAITLRIIIEVQYKLFNHARPIRFNRNDIIAEAPTSTRYEEEKQSFISNLFKHLSANPKGVRMQKTVISLIMTAISRCQVLVHPAGFKLKHNAQYLKECLKDRKNNNILEVMRSKEFDKDIFGLTIRLFKWYDFETKLVFLDFYRQVIQEGALDHNIGDFSSFKGKNFLSFLRDLQSPRQELYMISIVTVALQNSNEQQFQIRNFAEHIVSSIVKCYFNTSLQVDIEGALYDEEVNFLKTIKKLFLIMDPYDDSLLAVINDVLLYVQEVVNWVWSYVLHDSNRTNLNLKLILFLQQIEEVIMKKLAQQHNGSSILQNEQLYEMMSRLIVIFEHTKILYFDQPNPQVIEFNRRNTVVPGMLKQKETLYFREISFLIGGPLRVFTSLFLQFLRKMRPMTEEQTISSDEEQQHDEEEKKQQPHPQHQKNEKFQYFDLAVEIFRYYIFKQESQYIQKFRPVPTIEPHSADQENPQAPLFRMIYNSKSAKKNLYVLQPVDLTKQFIESYNESDQTKDTITSTPGFLPLLLINELFEIIKRKYALLNTTLEAAGAGLADQRYHVLETLSLLYDVLRHGYMNEEFKESIGYMMITITDPRLKEEIYQCLNPNRSSLNTQRNLQPSSGQKMYFLGRSADFSLRERFNAQDSIILQNEEPKPQNQQMLFIASMQDNYFRRSSETGKETAPGEVTGGFLDFTIPQQMLKVSQEQNENFAQLELNINKVEEQQKVEDLKDFTKHQDELITIFTHWYTTMQQQFGGQKQGQQVSSLNEAEMLNNIKTQYIDNKRIQKIMLAFRMITSEKFNHAHILSFNQREAYEISRIRNVFQVIPEHTSESSEKTKQDGLQNVKQEHMGSSGGGNDNSNLLQNSTPTSKFHLNLPIGTGGMVQTGSNFTPMKLDYNPSSVQQVMSARKRSDFNEVDSGFEFNTQPQNNPLNEVGSHEGKSSISSFKTKRPLVKQNSIKAKNRHYHTIEYFYSKQCYKKILKRLFEDPSSLWYDNLEQIKLDYQEMKEIYDLAIAMSPDQIDVDDDEESKQDRRGTQIKGAVNPPSYKSRQYDHFVRQRRTHDMWGRMLLLKPDRKYKQSKFLVSHKYFVHDTLKNLFAVSLLEDADFADYNQMLEYLEKKAAQQKGKNNEQNPQQENPQQSRMTAHSESFKRLRDLLMAKIEQNDFLYTLFTEPDAFLNEGNRPFEFHPLTKQMDSSLQHLAEAQLISVEGAQLGELYISHDYIMFQAKPEMVNPEIKFAMKQDQIIKKKRKVWPVSQLEQVFRRRFALMSQGLEIFTREKKSYFFNLLTEPSFNSFYNTLKGTIFRYNKAAPHKKIDLVDDPKSEFKNRKIFEAWSSGDLSTQEFLLLVNKYSGRSFNDFAQYPIFPWILNDYSCSSDDFKKKTEKNETDGFRDLLLNSAILSEKKLNYVKDQFVQSSQINEGEPMIYGDQPHHLKFGMSSRLFALSFLIRMQPFTDNFIKINNGLDNPDRIFFSFADQWHSLLNDPQNNCELTPEFFYLPEIFRNHNLANLGKSRTNQPVNEVILPRWASNEHDFVRIQREFLESKHVAKQLRAWLDMLFGARQKDEGFYNVYFCYAYEDYVREHHEEMEQTNVETILEFMQVPQKLFAKPLFTIDKKAIGASMNIHSQAINFNMAAIEEENEEGEETITPPTPQPVSKQQQKVLDRQAMVSAQYNKQMNKLTADQRLRQQQMNVQVNTRTLREGAADIKQQPNEFKSSSLIQKLLNYKMSQNQKKTENDLRKIYEFHKIDKPDDNQIFHMAFSQLNGQIFVFLADKDTQQVHCVACRENFLQENLKSLKPLAGLRRPNLKGDYNNIFQLYGGAAFKDRQQAQAAGTGYRHPLLFTCQNLDNSIKVFDLNIKKASQIVHVERKHNALVTAIKFSQDFKYFISGDADGVICHYVRSSGKNQSEARDDSLLQNNMNASVLNNPGQAGFGKNQQAQLDNQQSDKFFPFTLKYKFQDHSDSILSIDINYTLDMYVTASRDGNLAIRCLRTATLWKVIPLEKLTQADMEVLCLKLSLHGYVVVMIRNSSKFFTFVFSINGDQLVSTQRENELFEYKYAQLTQTEDHMIMVFNMKVRKEQVNFDGVIRVSRLYDLEKDPKKDNLQQTFYQMIHDQSTGVKRDDARSTKLQTHRSTAGQSENATGFTRTPMPPVQSFALSQDESKMNMYLAGGTIVCFDESRSNIIDQLDDFGLA